MTTAVNIHVNGRYRATVQQDDREPVIVEGNYAGSPNPLGDKTFYLAHPAKSTFVVTEEYVPDAPKVPAAVEEVPAAAEAPAAEAKPAPEADQTA